MTKRIGLAAGTLAVLSMVACEVRASEPGASGAKAASVLLVADPREAGNDCPCGEIIKAVRDAKAKGVRVREVSPSDTLVTRQYKVTVAPTVLILNPDGTEKARHEGESEETLAAIKAALARLAPGGA